MGPGRGQPDAVYRLRRISHASEIGSPHHAGPRVGFEHAYTEAIPCRAPPARRVAAPDPRCKVTQPQSTTCAANSARAG
eukprot:7391921-Prymnesium_polylepis.1